MEEIEETAVMRKMDGSHTLRGAGYWYPCDYPERPADINTAFALRCRACTLGAIAALKNGWPGATVRSLFDNGEYLVGPEVHAAGLEAWMKSGEMMDPEWLRRWLEAEGYQAWTPSGGSIQRD